MGIFRTRNLRITNLTNSDDLFHASFSVPDLEFKQILALRPIRESGVSDEAIRRELNNIVFQNQIRFESDYFDLMKEGLEEGAKAAKHLGRFIERFSVMDKEHFTSVWAVLGKLAPDLAEQSYSQILGRVSDLQRVLLLVSVGIVKATGVTLEPKGKGRPPSKYIMPALELVQLWQRLTSTKVVNPRGSSKGLGSEQVCDKPSAEFVRLGLKMIDPAVNYANAATSIKHAISLERKALSGETAKQRKLEAKLSLAQIRADLVAQPRTEDPRLAQIRNLRRTK